jgi:hypothetical protein
MLMSVTIVEFILGILLGMFGVITVCLGVGGIYVVITGPVILICMIVLIVVMLLLGHTVIPRHLQRYPAQLVGIVLVDPWG